VVGLVLVLLEIQGNKMVVLVVLVTVRLEDQLYLDKEMMLVLLLDSAQMWFLVVVVRDLLADYR
jgi:hypothetical protein